MSYEANYMSITTILAEVGAIPTAITGIEAGIPLIEKLIQDAEAAGVAIEADAVAVWDQIKALIALFSPAPAVAAATAGTSTAGTTAAGAAT